MKHPIHPIRTERAKINAKVLRKNMTRQEKHLWYDCLKLLPVQFYRQYAIENYILDFYCPKARLAIELDGSQHFEPKALEYDKQRTTVIERYGITVIRYTNRDIDTRFRFVCDDIYNHLANV